MHWRVIDSTLDFQDTVHLHYTKEQVEGQGLTYPEHVGMLSRDTIYSTSDSKHTVFCTYSEKKNVRVSQSSVSVLSIWHQLDTIVHG